MLGCNSFCNIISKSFALIDLAMYQAQKTLHNMIHSPPDWSDGQLKILLIIPKNIHKPLMVAVKWQKSYWKIFYWQQSFPWTPLWWKSDFVQLSRSFVFLKLDNILKLWILKFLVSLFFIERSFVLIGLLSSQFVIILMFSELFFFAPELVTWKVGPMESGYPQI